MLIRSSPAALERKRVPFGPLRINQDHPLAPFCKGLWLFSTNTFGQDLTNNSPRFTLVNGSFPSTNKEGLSLDSHTATGGAYINLPAALRITSGHGLSTYVRWVSGSSAPDAIANVFGVAYDNFGGNPYVVNMLQRQNSTDLYHMHNYGGVYGGGVPSAGNTTANVVTSNVVSHTFGVSFKGYQAGIQTASELTNTAAPTYGTTPQILFGSDTYNSRNPNINLFICGIFNQGLTLADSLDLETNPYALVEPVRTMLWMGPANAAVGGKTNILLGNTFGRPFNSFGRPF